MPSFVSRLVIPVAIVANAFITITKFALGGWSGSSAMMSEAVHSAVDTGEGLLLLAGVRLGRRPRDAAHPFGYRKVLYHWSLVAGVAIFAAGAALAIYQGVRRLRNPGEAQGWQLNLLVIAAAAIFEGVYFVVAWRRVRRPRDAQDAEAVPPREDRAAFVGLVEDGAALLGLALAALGIVLGRLTGSSVYDAGASIAIGCVLGVVAIVQAREARLPAGAEREDVVQSIRASAEGTPGLTAVNRVLTMQIGPRRILVALDVALEQGLTDADLGRTLRRLEEKIRRAHPVVRHIYVDVHPASGTSSGQAH